jgi:hypothetical protein
MAGLADELLLQPPASLFSAICDAALSAELKPKPLTAEHVF